MNQSRYTHIPSNRKYAWNKFQSRLKASGMSFASTAILLGVGFLTVGCESEFDPNHPPMPLQTTRVVAETGTQLGQFIYPRGMDIYELQGQSRVVVVDKTARIQELDLSTGEVLGAVHTPRWDRGKPTGLTVSRSMLDPSKEAVYVADTHEHRVLMYELPLPKIEPPVPTEPDWMIGTFGHEPTQFVYPTDIAIDTDADGSVRYIYISEYGGNDRISKFSVDHSSSPPMVNFVQQLGRAGERVDATDHPMALSRPQSIELWVNPVSQQQELVLTDASHHRVGRFTTQGELIRWYGDPLDQSENAFRFPYGLTILQDDTALITEFGGNRVRCLDLVTGEILWSQGIGGRSVGEIVQPWDAGVLNNALVILDSGNSRLQVCTLPSDYPKLANELAGPEQTRNAQSVHGNVNGAVNGFVNGGRP